MAQIIGLPKLSPTMEEGVLAKWHRKEGDKISPGDIIAEVETDKANMDFPLEDEGTLLKLLVKEGDTVRLGAPVAILGDPGEDVSALEKQAREQMAAAGQGATVAAEPAKKAEPAEGASFDSAQPSGPRSAQDERDTSPTPEAAPIPAESPTKAAPSPDRPATTTTSTTTTTGQGKSGNGSGALLASPIAKTLAAENGIDLRGLKGSGPGGRIVERDVRAAMEGKAADTQPSAPPAMQARAPAPGSAPAAARPAAPKIEIPEGSEFVDKSLSMLRKTVAKRMTESKTTVPHFYLTAECDAGPLLAFREAMQEAAGDEAKISVNDLIVKGVALALRRVPAVNASFLGDRIRYHGRVHVGVAVSIEDGLLTPVVFDADRKGVRQISAEIRELATRARAKKLHPEEMTGSTFTVSNLGMFGIDHFEAIINPPEGAILAVGRARKVPVVAGDKLVVGERMALTVSCDHRVVDGALGAQFLQALVKILEHPASFAL